MPDLQQIKSDVPNCRITTVTTRNPNAQVNVEGEFVLYWMIANRRANWNFSLQRAVDWSRHLGKPLVVLEALRAGYQWASDRIHGFVIQGMLDNASAFAGKPVSYYPYLEQKQDDGKGLLEALASRACLVVTDDFPCFFLPRMVRSVGKRLNTVMEAIDSNGLMPMRVTDRVFSRAFDFRRYLQKNLLEHLFQQPKKNPFQKVKIPKLQSIPNSILKKWRPLDPDSIKSVDTFVERLPIDHSVKLSKQKGGSKAGQKRLRDFIDSGLPLYCDSRNEPEQQVTSGLSPYLHFGHLSAHEVFTKVSEFANWDTRQVAEKANGSSSGWWGTSETVESFFDELITWREIGYNMCALRDDYAEYSSLPGWAQKTLADHSNDPREHSYDLEAFEKAETHDDLWNAAQRQLVREGRIHNYLRMLWGKKILHWTESPQLALEIMIELNNKYALDGRNPNSYSGIFWVLGRYDRAWGPEREIFGKIRYMTCANTRKKIKVNNYIKKFSANTQSQPDA